MGSQKYTQDSKEIDKLSGTLKKYSFKELKKHRHYYDSILYKNTDEKILEKYYPETQRIKLVIHRIRDNGNENYDFHYEISKNQFIVYAIDLNKIPPLIINGFIVNTNLNNMAKSIKKRYQKF